MSVDERILELIHGELDGVNDADGQAELARLIETDPAVRHEHERLTRMQQTIAAAEPFEAPVGLKTAIMAGVAAADAASPARGRSLRRWFAGLADSPMVRTAGLAAAAAVIMALAVPFVIDGQSVDPEAARGTIGAGIEAAGPGEVVNSGIIFVGAEGTVQVAPTGTPGLWIAEVTVDAVEPLRIELATGSARLVAAETLDGGDDALRRNGAGWVWVVDGRGSIRLTITADESTTLELHGTRGEAGIGSASVPIGRR